MRISRRGFSTSMLAVLRSKHFHSFLGIFVSVAMLAWVVQMVDVKEVGQQLLSADLIPFLFAFPVFALHFLLRAMRWRYLLVGGEGASLRNLFDAIMVGNLANFLLPLRAGEFIRPYMLSKKEEDITFHGGFLSVVTERFFDLSAVLLTFSFVVRSQEALPDWVRNGALALAFVALIIFLYIIGASLFPRLITGVTKKILSFCPDTLANPLLHIMDDILESARVLAKPKNLVALVILTALVWLSSYLLFYIFLFLLPLPTSPLLAITVAVIIALAVAAPSAPGFIGVYQTACFAAFALYNVQEDLAVSYSVLTHIFQYVIFVSYGFFALWRSGLTLGDLRKRAA